MSVNRRLSSIGIALQAAKGTAAPTPIYGFGLLSGQTFGLEIAQAAEALTGGTLRIPQDVDRTGIRPGFTFATRVYPQVIPLLAYGALGAKAVSGAGPYLHTDSLAASLGWYTVWGKYGSEYFKIVDCKFDQLTISWTRGPIMVQGVIMGLTALLHQSSFTPTNDMQGQPRFSTFGGTFSLDTASGTPASAKVISGQVAISNGIGQQELSANVLPTDLIEGTQSIETTLTVEPDDWALYNEIVTGTGTGTTPSGTPNLGSFDVLMSIDANTDLEMSATRWAPIMATPDVDPAGGPAQFPLVGQLVGTDFAVKTHNAVASYTGT